MPKVDFAKAKSDIAEIVEIVKTVPDGLQQRCFELLFELAFSEAQPNDPPRTKPEETKKDVEVEKPATGKKLPSNVLAFIHRCGVSREELGKLFMLDHDPLLPVYQIPSGNIAKGQLSKLMMVLLENGLVNNSLSAPYAEIRESLKDDGLLDKNLTGNLRRQHPLFRSAIKEDGIDEAGTVELTAAGFTKLAETIKELGQ